LDVIRQFMKLIRDFDIYEAILIIDAPLSSKANQALSEITNAKWQVFSDMDLTYNPSRHHDTALHRRLDEAEKGAKLVEMKTDLSKLPIMKINDPIARYYGWSAGDLIEITRHDSAISILTPKTINYRVVVASW
jgi:DNA-directed RNA polymerase I, II, and III subunit RPABC1